MVGVMLDTMRQVETHLIQRHYDGFLRKGRIRGANQTVAGRGEAVQQGVLVWACVAAAVLLVVGLSLFLATHLR
jgi:preprotein translocase subunit SecY